MEIKPKYFKRTSKLPTETELAIMKEKIIALSDNNKQPSIKESEPMTNKNDTVGITAKPTKPRKRLTSEQVAKMIKEWDDKTVSEFSKEFDVSYQTISKMAEIVRKDDASLCPKKDAVKVKREDIAKAAIALFRKEKGKN